MAQRVVALVLVLVAQHCVRLGRLLELLLGVAVAGVAVGVELEGELAVGRLDLGVAGVARHPQHFVVVTLGGGGHASEALVPARSGAEHGLADDGRGLLHGGKVAAQLRDVGALLGAARLLDGCAISSCSGDVSRPSRACTERCVFETSPSSWCSTDSRSRCSRSADSSAAPLLGEPLDVLLAEAARRSG